MLPPALFGEVFYNWCYVKGTNTDCHANLAFPSTQNNTMAPLSSEMGSKSSIIGRSILYAFVNIFACLFIPYFLFFAHSVFNGLIIPRRFFYSVTRPDQDLTPLYGFSLIIIVIELAAWIAALYSINRWYCRSLLEQKSPLTARITTAITGIISTVLSVLIFWFMIEKL